MRLRLISPPLSDLSKLRQPLTAGEKLVLDFFNHFLPLEWEIYIQPHLNGLRPDFVLLNPQIGIGVFEVKDWNLERLKYFTKKNEKGHELWGKSNEKEFSLEKQNPFPKIKIYKEEIFNLYCPRLRKKNGWAITTGGIIFPFSPRKAVEAIFSPFINKNRGQEYSPVSCMEDLHTGNLGAVFPEARNRTFSFFMSKNHASDLRGWLVEPDFSKMQRLPLPLDRNQKNLATTRTTSGYRRLKGPAGSGKSLVLAARAAQLAQEDKKILIVTFNITLWHYLKDLFVRAIDKPNRVNNIEFTHFHLWCKHVCIHEGIIHEYERLIGQKKEIKDILDFKLPFLVQSALKNSSSLQYDAILVDEGQDYRPLWWNTLRRACKKNGEMLLVADTTQDVYGTATAWTDEAIKGAGFPGGRWAELHTSYRLPPDIFPLARDFAQRFLPQTLVDLPEPDQGSLALAPSSLRWVQCDIENSGSICRKEILSLMKKTGEKNLANADITVLTSNRADGLKVIVEMNDTNIKILHTFDQTKDLQEERRKKMGFYMGDARMKITTIHSFKGWEARTLVVYITNTQDDKAKATIYTAMTRLKRDPLGCFLTIICTDPALKDYGSSFPDFQNVPLSFRGERSALT